MASKYSLQIHPNLLEHLAKILDILTTDYGKTSAENFYYEFNEKIKLLSSFPLLGVVVDIRFRKEKDIIRKLYLKNYKIYYYFDEKNSTILLIDIFALYKSDSDLSKYLIN